MAKHIFKYIIQVPDIIRNSKITGSTGLITSYHQIIRYVKCDETNPKDLKKLRDLDEALQTMQCKVSVASIYIVDELSIIEEVAKHLS